MDIHDIMENWKPGRFTKFVDDVIEQLSHSSLIQPPYEKFGDLLLETAWTARKAAELDERLGAKVYGLAIEVPLEMLKIMRLKWHWMRLTL
jgi:hypothetical protein